MAQPVAKIVGENVERARKARGWTQSDLGSRAGVAQSRIAELEKGEINHRIDTVARVAAALDISIASLFIPADSSVST